MLPFYTDITQPPDNPKMALVECLMEKKRRWDTSKLYRYYPDTGPLRRELYQRHTDFFDAGSVYFERLMLAANRVGKTEGVGGYEMVLHLTGRYPEWWKGKRFNKPIKAWAAGDTSKTVRDIIQQKLLGDKGSYGTGLIPQDDLVDTKPKSGIPDAEEIIRVKHVGGGSSLLILKSYDQGREAFQGTEQDVIWLDEEPPLDVYTECLMRLMTTNGTMMCTFTPLEGISQTVMYFLPNGDWHNTTPDDNKFIVMATWDDAPHLTEEQKKRLWSGIPEYQRDARTKGIPQLGSGAIYPIPESEILVNPFEIPPHYTRAYGFDVGWNRTAAIWGAIDRDTDTCY